MLARFLHGALALSLATEPAAAEGEPVAEPTATDDPSPAEPPPADAPPSDEAEAPAPEPADEPPATEPEPTDEPEPEPQPEVTPPPSPAEAVATEAPRPPNGVAPTGRNDDIVSKALLGGGIASLTLTAGLIGTSAWAWTEHNRAKRAIPNLTGDEQTSAEDRRDTMRTIGVVTTGAAVLYGTTGVVLLLLRARDRKSEPRTVLAPSPGGLSLVGRF